MDWVLAKLHELPTDGDIISAIQYGALDNMVAIASAVVPPPLISALQAIYDVKCNQLAMIKWLHTNNGIFSPNVTDNAARFGLFDVVKWLHFNRDEGCTQMQSTSLHVMDIPILWSGYS